MKITEPVVVRKMRYDEIPEALRVYEEAFEGDPLEHYMKDTPDAHPGRYEELERLDNSLRFPQAVRKGQLLAIGEPNVDAFVTVTPPHEVEDNIDGIIKVVMPVFGAISSHMLSPQQKERAATFKRSFRAAREAVGDRVKEMLVLSGIVTRPAKQGRGYGSALVRAITDRADREGRAIWLGSSNVANRGFYELFGFAVVAQVTVGEDDPTWHEPAVVVDLMIREPRTPRAKRNHRRANFRRIIIPEYS